MWRRGSTRDAPTSYPRVPGLSSKTARCWCRRWLPSSLEYLFETGRTSEPARRVLQALSRDIGLRLCDLPFPDVVEVAVRQSWTRDPFDRIIVGQAALRRAPLVTRDEDIRAHYDRALWGR